MTEEGGFSDDCLCSVLLALERSTKEATFTVHSVGASKTLYLRAAAWGSYWGQELKPEVFRERATPPGWEGGAANGLTVKQETKEAVS